MLVNKKKILDEEERAKRTQSILRCLKILSRSIQEHSRAVGKQSGISSAKLMMLSEIFNNPGLKVSDLARALVIHASTCSNLLDKLQESGLIKRDRTGRDQRTVRVFLTDRGKQLLTSVPRPAPNRLLEGLTRMPRNYLLELDHGLANLVDMVEASEGESDLLHVSDG